MRRTTFRQACTSTLRSSSRSTAVVVRAQSSAAAATRTKRPQNVAGDFWVDSTCIDCDTCRWMAPDVFTAEGGQSAVTRQPQGTQERVRAMQALLSCPTFSIHNDGRTREELQQAQEGLPAPVPGVPGVYHCGWHSERSYAAASYLVVRPGLGNVLVDSPRFNPVLARQIEKLGGVDYMFLTHKDDVADHAQWAKHFGCVRVLHKGEVRRNTQDVEVQLEGEGPWSWAQHVEAHPAAQAMRQRKQQQRQQHQEQQGEPSGASTSGRGGGAAQQDEEDDMTLVFTPGHTSHHVALFVPRLKTIFTGDHLSAPEENGASGQLHVFKSVNWFDFPTQLDSVAKLLAYDWLHVLPGHGRQAHLSDALHRLKAVSELLQRHGAGGKLAAVAVAADGAQA